MDDRDPSEPQERRPPLYNPEDYVSGLKKFSKLTGLQLYLSDIEMASANPNTINNNLNMNKKAESNLNGGQVQNNLTSTNNRKNKKGRLRNNLDEVDSTNPSMYNDTNKEMGLRQFATITELLAKLRSDLQLAYPSFMRELIGSQNDGVTWLVDALKSIQLSQTNITGSLNQLGSRANHFMFKRALNDEFAALLCLKMCSRSEEGALKLVEHPSGLFTVAVCVMSNFSKSRILSLQLLSRLCDLSNGHKQVSDALSMLRLRFGEPVRFKFLVGMLNSYNSDIFQVSCLRFLNRFIETAKDARERIMIQTELEEAGFELLALKKRLLMANNASTSDEGRLELLLQEEIQRWTHNYIDVNGLVRKLLNAERANKKLREEIGQLLNEKARQNTKTKAEHGMENVSCGCCSCDEAENSSDGDRNDKAVSDSKTSVRNFSANYRESMSTSSTTTTPTLNHSITTFYDQVSFDVEIDEEDENESEQQHCSLVTVLASDGYTCVTSPLIDTNLNKSLSSTASIRIVADSDHFGSRGADSGLSSDSSDPSPRRANSTSSASTTSSTRGDFVRPETHFRTYRSDDQSDKSSYSEKHDKEASRENENPNESEDTETSYDERNVLQEEATSVQTETISVEKLRAKYDSARDDSSLDKTPRKIFRQKSSFELRSIGSQAIKSKEESPKMIVPSKVMENISRFEEISSKSPKLSRFGSRDLLDNDIVPKKTPRPPARRRPKSTPITHPRNSQITHLVPEGKREMVFLPDLSDGETSDGGVSNDFVSGNDDSMNYSNTNTLETMSARSFGFVRPSPQLRQNELAKRLRRHQSFLEPSTDSSLSLSGFQSRDSSAQTPPTKPARQTAIRRSESFQHNHELSYEDGRMSSHSSAIFRFAIARPGPDASRARGKSAERMLDEEDQKLRPIHKSKSMEFLKAKLLSRKGTTKSNQPNGIITNGKSLSRSQSPASNQYRHNNDHLRGKINVQLQQQHQHQRQQEHRDQYDWRQDTPFWNHRGRWSRPAPLASKVTRPQATVGSASLHPFQQKVVIPSFSQNAAGNNAPLGPWAPRQYPGLFLGNSFYPRPFAIANPQNPKNVSHNIFMAPPSLGSPQHRFGAPHPTFAHAVAQAAAAAAQAQAQSATLKRSPSPNVDDLGSRLEIIELSDGEDDEIVRMQQRRPDIPSPDYSTMRSSPAESVTTVIHQNGSTLSKGKGHILDIPSGLY